MLLAIAISLVGPGVNYFAAGGRQGCVGWGHVLAALWSMYLTCNVVFNAALGAK